MRRLFLLLFILIALTPATAKAADCEFVLGFATLRDLVGHEIVGECLENERYNEIGDSVQQTTGGLLAWRKADNWTAFTDGYLTYINGPVGLQWRLNSSRYFWEADYLDHDPVNQRLRCLRLDERESIRDLGILVNATQEALRKIPLGGTPADLRELRERHELLLAFNPVSIRVTAIHKWTVAIYHHFLMAHMYHNQFLEQGTASLEGKALYHLERVGVFTSALEFLTQDAAELGYC